MIIKQAICLSDEQTGLEIKAALDKIAAVRLQNAEEIQSLSGFITSERDMHLMDFLIIDLRAQIFSASHIISAMQMMKRFCKTEPVFIAENCSETDILIGKLAEIDIKNCIKVTAETDIAAEVFDYVSGERQRSFAEMQTVMQNAVRERIKKEVSPQLEIPKNAALTISVFGAMERIGTTTQTIGIYHYLKSVGFTPIIVDKTQKIIEFFAEIYSENVKEYENSIEINGVHFGTDILIGTQFNAFICELGTGGELPKTDFTVLVGGSKEWEFQKTIGKMQSLSETEGLKVILSFTEEKTVSEIAEDVGVKMYAAPFKPDFWHSENAEANQFYRRIFYEDVKEYCRKCEC